jgi:hypothetical protein
MKGSPMTIEASRVTSLATAGPGVTGLDQGGLIFHATVSGGIGAAIGDSVELTLDPASVATLIHVLCEPENVNYRAAVEFALESTAGPFTVDPAIKEALTGTACRVYTSG